jgi:hypothetical protein
MGVPLATARTLSEGYRNVSSNAGCRTVIMAVRRDESRAPRRARENRGVSRLSLP